MYNFILLISNYTYFPNVKELLTNYMKINLTEINQTREILNKLEGKTFKFGEENTYPLIKYSDYADVDKYFNFVDWKNSLDNIIDTQLKPNFVYSLAILKCGVEGGNRICYSTVGPHILVTKDIDRDSLKTYIEGAILVLYLNVESGFKFLEVDDSLIFFKYREISISKGIHDAVSKLKHSEKLKILPKDLERINIKESNNKINIEKVLDVLPLNKNIDSFGALIAENYEIDNKIGNLYKYSKEINIFVYKKTDLSYDTIVYKNGIRLIEFRDEIVNNNKHDIIRKIAHNTLYIKNNEIIAIDSVINSWHIGVKQQDLNRDKNIITFDIECYLDENNNFIPYMCAWYKWNYKLNKEIYKCYTYKHYDSWEEMIVTFFNDIEKVCNKYTIFIHNLSNFDGVYILKCLVKKYKPKVLFKDGKVISINISIPKKSKKDNSFYFTLKDSLKLLPLSLDKLTNDFDIDTKKLPFPYKFVRWNNLNYVGSLPNYEYFFDFYNDENIKKYEKLQTEFKNKTWNLMEESKKYIYNDVKALFEIINKFSKEVFDLEKVNITNNLSISSLALNVFLTNYYNALNMSLYIPKYEQYVDLHPAYFGGRVEVFEQYGEDLHVYDVNSLYSKVMLNDMPIGPAIKSTDTDLDNYFGFCYATVNVPDSVYNPILPFRDGLGNIYNPTGTWTSMFSSELLKYAKEVNNVEVKVHYGYKYEKGKDLFKSYIEKYFDLKRNATNESRRIIAKLMLNSLYGRWGLRYFDSITKFMTTEEFIELSLKYQILDNIKFSEDNNIELVKYSLKPSDILKEFDNEAFEKLNSEINNNQDFIVRCLPLSAMITSYAISYMYKFLNLPNNKCYYSDTDSMVLEKPLDPKYIGDGLGQFKYVGKIKRGYFISPKLYCLILENGQTIIKAKGIKSEFLKEQDFKEMLYGCSKTFKINRFVTNLKHSNIEFLETDYHLKPEILKRNVIIKNGLIVDTKPFKITDGILNINKYKPNLNIVKFTD
jgi:hypothetical protein